MMKSGGLLSLTVMLANVVAAQNKYAAGIVYEMRARCAKC